MSTSKKLLERLARHPQLEKRVSDLLDVIEAESGNLDRADEAEEAVISHLGEMGSELLTDWGLHKEDQRFKAAKELHPEAKSRKKHLLAEHLRKNRATRALPDCLWAPRAAIQRDGSYLLSRLLPPSAASNC